MNMYIYIYAHRNISNLKTIQTTDTSKLKSHLIPIN